MKNLTPSNKTKFEDTPVFNMWRDREDMADVENFVSQLRKPIDLGMTDEEIDNLFKRDKDTGRDIDLTDI